MPELEKEQPQPVQQASESEEGALPEGTDVEELAKMVFELFLQELSLDQERKGIF